MNEEIDLVPKNKFWTKKTITTISVAAIGIFLLIANYSPLTAFLLIIVVVSGPLAVYTTALQDKFYGLIQEGYAMAIEKNGEFERIEFRYRGKILETSGKIRDAEPNENLPTHIFGGLVFIGIYPFWRAATYTLRWGVMRPNGEILYRTQKLNRVLLKKYTSLIELKKKSDKEDDRPETMEKVPTDTKTFMTSEVINVYVYLYGPQDAYEMAIARAKQLIKEYIGSKSIDELITQSKESERMLYKAMSAELTQKLKEDKQTGEDEVTIVEFIEREYGIRIIALDLYSIVLPDDIIQLATAPYKETKAAEALVIKSGGQAKSQVILAAAKSVTIVTVYNTMMKYGTLGMYLRTLETYEEMAKTGKATFGLMPMGSVDGLSKMFIGSGMSEENIRKLSEQLKDIKPEELIQTFDVMKIIKDDPRMKAIWDTVSETKV